MKFITSTIYDTKELTKLHVVNINCITDIYMEMINVNGEKKVSQIVVSLSNGENFEITGDSAIEFYRELKAEGVIN